MLKISGQRAEIEAETPDPRECGCTFRCGGALDMVVERAGKIVQGSRLIARNGRLIVYIMAVQ